MKADHGVEAKRLRSFARAVDYILADQEFLRESFHLAVHDFIEHQRQHLEKEERLLFPAAVKALRSEDWAEIDARWMTGRIRCSTAWSKRNLITFKKTILRWEQETEETRLTMTQTQH